YKPGVKEQGNGLFCEEHSCRLSDDGYIYLFNNNACKGDSAIPTVIMMEEPKTDTGSLKKVWEYTCNVAGVSINPHMAKMKENQRLALQRNKNMPMSAVFKMHPTSGGHVLELPDQSVFICMNTEFCKLLIVSRDKKILWSAIPEKYDDAEKEWVITAQQY